MNKIDYQEIINEISPKEKEKREIKSLYTRLIGLIDDVAYQNDINAQAVLVGSVAKGTWLSGKADVDIFIKFPLETPPEYLKEKGLFLGERCINKMNGKREYRYASHPYITGIIDGLEIDFVPCYDIRKTNKIKSAVDRTIPHTEYVKKYLTAEEAGEVLLLKCFTKTIDTYGSEFKVGGFAGYLCELLILHYKTFLNVLESASINWKPNYHIDLADHGTADQFNEPLIVIDPVDPNRNVAAALSLQKLAEFVAASRNFLKDPSLSYFRLNDIPADLGGIKETFKERGTKTLILTFKAPDIPADALYPQIKKTSNSIVRLVERNDFKFFGSDFWTDDETIIVILLELETWNLPVVKKHRGPPVWSKSHEEKFLEKYKENAWLEGDVWVSKVDREYKDVASLIKAALSKEEINLLQFGKHVKSKILDEYELMDIEEFLASTGNKKDVIEFLYLYLNKGYRIMGGETSS